MRYGLRMGLGLGLSGVANAGHDIGGFAGPCPSPELLLRWVEAGVFLPRFSIHSWNDDGSVTEPWTHEAVAPRIAALVRFRARLAPYLYDLLWAAHERFDPVLRPTLAEFEEDPETAAPCDEAMLGPALLLAPVVEPSGEDGGIPQRSVYLPAGAAWYALGGGFDAADMAAVGVAPGAPLPGGRRVTVPAPLGMPPLFARAGSIVALDIADRSCKRGRRLPTLRAFWLFPAPCKNDKLWAAEEASTADPCCAACTSVEYCGVEDDGESLPGSETGGVSRWRVNIACNGIAGIGVSVRRSGGCRVPPPLTVTLILPPGFQRTVTVTTASWRDGAAATAASDCSEAGPGAVSAVSAVSDSGFDGSIQPEPYSHRSRELIVALG